jgi:hypothetical protein
MKNDASRSESFTFRFLHVPIPSRSDSFTFRFLHVPIPSRSASLIFLAATFLTLFTFALGSSEDDIKLIPSEILPFRVCEVRDLGSGVIYDLGRVISGFELAPILRVYNKSSATWTNLRTEGSCGCTQAKSLNGVSVPPNGFVDLEFRVVPGGESSFRQKVDLFASMNSSTETSRLVSVLFNANSRSPVQVSPRDFTLKQLMDGKVSVGIVPGAKGVEIVWDEIAIADRTDLELTVPRDPLTFSAQIRSLPDQSFLSATETVTIRVPFRREGLNQLFYFEAPLRFSDSPPFRLLPKTIVLPSNFQVHKFSLAVMDKRLDAGEPNQSIFEVRLASFGPNDSVTEQTLNETVLIQKSNSYAYGEISLTSSMFSSPEVLAFALRVYIQNDNGTWLMLGEIPVVK